MVNEFVPSTFPSPPYNGYAEVEDENENKSKPSNWDIPFSLPLLFFTSQFDFTLQTYNYHFTETFMPSYEKPANNSNNSSTKGFTKKTNKSSITLLPNLKRNFANVLQNAKHKVAQAFLCLACVKGEVVAEDGICSTVSKNLPDQYSEKNDLPPTSKEVPSTPLLEKIQTISEYVDSGISSLATSSPNTLSDPEVFTSSLESDLDLHEKTIHSSDWVTEIATEGINCFQEAKMVASKCQLQVCALQQTVALNRFHLREALCQLWSIEEALRDFQWESMDRDTWIYHLLPLRGSTSRLGDYQASLMSNSHSAPSMSTISLASSANDYAWDWSIV